MKEYLVKAVLFVLPLLLVCGTSDPAGLELVVNGKTAYTICLDPSAPGSVRLAAEDLQRYFRKVTGASPEIILSSQVCAPPYISLGQTAAATAAGLDASGLPNDGYRMITIEKNMYILGPDTPTGEVNSLGGVNNGTSNGVYAFIEDYLGVHWVMPGELGEEYRTVSTLSLPALDRMEHSPFTYRVMGFRSKGPLEDEWDRRMRLGEVAAVEHEHAWTQTIPASAFEEHPEWFARKDGQPLPPFGRYKFETTNPELVQAYADKIIETFRSDPKRRWYSLSPSDGGGWSDSPESQALIEKIEHDPFNRISVTPLVLSFYNDVAKIVGREFPDHKLGGYMYGTYMHPPSTGVPEIEPNLSIMLAVTAYGLKKYRPDEADKSGWLMRTWGKSASKYGFDVYFYDLPISLMQPNGVLWPMAPDLLNFIFYRQWKYGFKGGYIYGNPVWPAFGAGNYAIARLLWNPDQDAATLLSEYFGLSYGEEAGELIGKIFELLDTDFCELVNRYPEPVRSPNVTEDMLKLILGPKYPVMEQLFLEALKVRKEPKQQQRLALFGQVLSLMQWNLRSLGYLPADYASPLTLDTPGVDGLLTGQKEDGRITRFGTNTPPAGVALMPPLKDAGKTGNSPVPVYRNVHMVLHALQSGEVRVKVTAFDPQAEFVQYTLSDPGGKLLSAGAMIEGRTISFNGKAGKSYFLHIPSRRGSMKLEVEGASVAYRVEGIAGKYMDGPLPLYFYVPEGTGTFSLTLGTPGAVADVLYPDGRPAGQLNCSDISVSRLLFNEKHPQPGFWKILLHPQEGADRIITLTIDEQLPQWFIHDPAHPLKVL